VQNEKKIKKKKKRKEMPQININQVFIIVNHMLGFGCGVTLSV
jgi:glutaredoxin